MNNSIEYDKVAQNFLQRWKEYVVSYMRKPSDAQDIVHFKQLISKNPVARDIVNNSRRLCYIYDNPEWQSKVLETLDLDLIYSNVDKMPLDNEDQYSDNLVKELLRYFKNDFFTWCNKPKCNQCGVDS